MDVHAMTTEMPARRKPPAPLNGVNTPALFATIDVVKETPALGMFQFRASSEWQGGTHSCTTISDFAGAGGEHMHKEPYTVDADHPAVLCGEDRAPAPVEFVLHALASCITAGIANIAAARGIPLYSVKSSLEGDINLRGILGLSKDVRNGFSGVRARFDVKGHAPEAKLRELVQQACARSAVLDILTNGIPVSIETNN